MAKIINTKHSGWMAAMATGLLATGACLASDAIDPGDSESTWVVGGGVGVYNNPYIGESTAALVNPNIRYNGKRFFVKDGSINYSFGEHSGFSGGVTLTGKSTFLMDDDFYDDNEQLDGIQERDATLNAGFYVNHTTDYGRTKLIVLEEITGEHDGRSADLRYSADLGEGRWHINPFVGAEWLSADEATYFYGVEAAEARIGRAIYEADNTVNLYGGVRVRYDITEHWDVDAVAGYKRLGSGITDSPIITDDSMTFTGVSVNYNF